MAKRALTSRRLRWLLWESTGGKCAICESDLPDNWHADHVIPFRVSGRTNVHEMQPLCPGCNLRKGGKMSRESMFDHDSAWGLDRAIPEKQRPGQIELIEKFQEWITNGCQGRTFSVYMCCRYGKADAQRNMAIIAMQENVAGAALVIHPYKVLAKQFLENSRMKEWQSRWLPMGPHQRISKVSIIPNGFRKGTMCNGEWIGSVNIQALKEPDRRAALRSWVDWCNKEYGKPPIFFFDEGHYYSGTNIWGEVSKELHSLGAITVSLTATPFRNDGDDPIGFRKKMCGEINSRVIKYVEPHVDPNKLILHTSVRDEQEYAISADVEVPFSQGWQEGCIAKASFDWIDWNMEGYGEAEGKSVLLSEMSKEESRKELPRLYRDNRVIEVAARRAVEHMHRYRKDGIEDATIIWFGMDDESGVEKGENQKAIKAALEKADPYIDVKIATLATNGDQDDEKADKTIERFTDPKCKNFDALVLKKMGAAGLDSDRICVVVLWNTTRSLAQMIQMMSRGGNTTTEKSVFSCIVLKDPVAFEKLDGFVRGEGGLFVESTETDHSSEEIDKKTQPLKGYIATSEADAVISDTDGQYATPDDVLLALKVASIFQGLIRHHTIPMIAIKAKKAGMAPVSIEEVGSMEFTDSSVVCSKIRTELNKIIKEITKYRFKKRTGGGTYQSSIWGEVQKEVVSEVKKMAGVFKSWDADSKECSDCPEDYVKWQKAAFRLSGEKQ